MTNKEIISSLRGIIGKYNLTDEEWQTIEKTIKVLNNSDEDCISRKDAEMCLTADITNMTIEEYISMVGDRLKELPSIQPKPKMGYWQNNACSNCGTYNASAYKNWCPNCGAKMLPTDSEKE